MGAVRRVKGEAGRMLFADQGTKAMLTTVEVATIHVLQVKGKTEFAASFAGNPTPFSENRSDLHQKLRPSFARF